MENIEDVNELFHFLADEGEQIKQEKLTPDDMLCKVKKLNRQTTELKHIRAMEAANQATIDKERDLLIIKLARLMGLDDDPECRHFIGLYPDE